MGEAGRRGTDDLAGDFFSFCLGMAKATGGTVPESRNDGGLSGMACFIRQGFAPVDLGPFKGRTSLVRVGVRGDSAMAQYQQGSTAG